MHPDQHGPTHAARSFAPKRFARGARWIAAFLGLWGLTPQGAAQITLGPAQLVTSLGSANLGESGVTIARAANGTSLVVWSDDRTGDHDVYGALVSPNGQPAGSGGGFRILGTAGVHEGDPQVAACGNVFLVVYGNGYSWHTTTDLFAVRVDTAGNVLDSSPIVVSTETEWQHNVRGPASDGGNVFAVAFRTRTTSIWGAINLLRIRASDGMLLDPVGGVELSAALPGALKKNATISFGAGRFLVTWDDGRDFCRYPGEVGCVDIYAAYVDPLTGHSGQEFATTSAYSCQEGAWSAFNGTDFVVSHSDERLTNCVTADLVAERVTLSGTVRDPVDAATGMTGSLYVAGDPSGHPNTIQSEGFVAADPCASVFFYRDFATSAGQVEFRVKRLDDDGRHEIGQDAAARGYLVDAGAQLPGVAPWMQSVRLGPFAHLGAYARDGAVWVRSARFKTPFKRDIIASGLRQPRGVAIDADGSIVVANTFLHRIDVFAADGAPLRQFGGRGNANGKFFIPSGVALSSGGDIHVADTGNHRIQVFDRFGRFKFGFGSVGTGQGQFLSPLGIAIASNGNIYVADTDNQRVQVFSPSGAFLFKFGQLGNQLGQFRAPRALAFDPQGRVLVAERDNNRVQRLTSGGVPLSILTASFRSPRGVAVDASGRVHVADSENDRVVVLRPDGQVHFTYGTDGTLPGQFRTTTAIALDARGRAYVADFENNRVQLFGCVP